MEAFLLCLIPLFVAMDPPGLIPVFLNITQGFTAAQRRRITLQAVPTALAIAVVFILVGRPLLSFLKIDIPDLQIAGGIILFVYALMDLMVAGKPMVREEQSLGIVPLATPLIVGPAVLTLCLVLRDQHGWLTTFSALIVNLLLVLLAMLFAERLLRWFPMNAMRAVSKVVDLLLAAIGVGFVRAGVLAIMNGA